MSDKEKHRDGGFYNDDNDIGTDQHHDLPEEGPLLDDFEKIDFDLDNRG